MAKQDVEAASRLITEAFRASERDLAPKGGTVVRWMIGNIGCVLLTTGMLILSREIHLLHQTIQGRCNDTATTVVRPNGYGSDAS